MLVCAPNVVEGDRSDEREPSNEKNVVSRSAGPRLQIAEKFLGQHVVSAHSKEQSCRSQRSGQSTPESRDDQDRAHGIEEDHASDPLHTPAKYKSAQPPAERCAWDSPHLPRAWSLHRNRYR